MSAQNRPPRPADDHPTDTAEAISDQRLNELLEEFESEEPIRKLHGWVGWLAAGLGFALSAYAIYWVVGIIPAQVYRPSFLALALVLCFILYPFARQPKGRSGFVTWALALIPVAVMGFIFVEWFVQREQRWTAFLENEWATPLLTLLGVTALVFALYALITTPRDQINVLDWALAVIAIIALSWPVIDLQAFVQRAARPNPVDLTLGTITVVLVLEATRRSVGWILPATAVIFLLYAYFGAVLDLIGLELIAHRGYELGRIIGSMYITLEGIFGVPLDVAATYIILFTIYGAVLEFSGAGKFFIDWAMSAMGRARDGAGPGRTVTVAGFLLGTVSGSGVATTVTLGSLSWPLLQKAGYDRETGGAILSAAGIGAILSPPTLGAAAFLISEFLRISYLQVLIMASIPTLLYYLSIFLMIEADSRRGGTRAITIATQPLVALSLRYGYHFTSLFAIAILMAVGMTPFFAVFWACVLAIALSFLRKDTAMWPNRLFKALEMGGKGVVGIVATCATAGIIVGVVTLTGLGLKVAGLIVQLAGGQVFLTVLFAALAVWVLGLAVPVTASYVIAAVMIVPALTSVGVPDFAAHMFIFYYAVLSEVSPPTALAPFAAAALTGGNPFKTMMLTWKYTLPAFLVPFIFTLSPEGLGILLRAPLQDVVVVTLTAAVGISALAVGFGGWLLNAANRWERVVAVVAGLLLFYANPTTDIIGFALFAVVIAAHVTRVRFLRSRTAPSA